MKKETNVFKNVHKDEITEYKKLFPKIKSIADRRVHCTTCDCHIGTAPINETKIKMHPVLRVLQCIKCYDFYTNGEFDRDHDGSELFCRWCGEGGEVYCCSKCPKVFCRRCIEQNLSIEMLVKIQNNQNWLCFSCDSDCMLQLRADYWALLKFIDTQKKIIMNKSMKKDEFKEEMSKDLSKCCINIMNNRNLKRKLSISLDKPHSVKRRSIRIQDTCTSKVLNDAVGAETKTLKVEPLTEIPDVSTEHIIQSISENAKENVLRNVLITTPAIKPRFHNINGFLIDLNMASEQDSYRLPNGRLIKVTKEPISTNKSTSLEMVTEGHPQTAISSTVSSPTACPSTINLPTLNTSTIISRTVAYPEKTSLKEIPGPSTEMPLFNNGPPTPVISTPNTNVRPSDLNNVVPPLHYFQLFQPTQMYETLPFTQPIMSNSSVNECPQSNSTIPTKIEINENLNVPQQNISLAFPIPVIYQINNIPNNPNPIQSEQNIVTTVPALYQINQNSNGSDPHKLPSELCISSVSSVPLNSVIDTAKLHIEHRVDDSIEECQRIIEKLTCLTNSPSFKNVKTFLDIKDLIVHLSNLFRYAGDRFNLLEEKCSDYLNEIGFDPVCINNTNVDLRIVENSGECNASDLELAKTNGNEDACSDHQMIDNASSKTQNAVEADKPENDFDKSLMEVALKCKTEPIDTNVNFGIVENSGETNGNDLELAKTKVNEVVCSQNAVEVDKFENGFDKSSMELALKCKTSSTVPDTINLIESETKPDKHNTKINIKLMDDKIRKQKTKMVPKHVRTLRYSRNKNNLNQLDVINTDSDINSDTDKEDRLPSTTNLKSNLLRSESICPLEIREEIFRKLFRLSKSAFKFLLDLIGPKFSSGENYIPAIHKLAATLHFLAVGSFAQSVSEDYSVSMTKSTSSLAITEVLGILDSMRDSFINSNYHSEQQAKCRKHYFLKMGFPGVIGIVDGIHIRISRPIHNEDLYHTKHDKFSLNVQITCDNNFLITSAVTNRGGQSNDGSVWSKSEARKNLVNKYRTGHKTSLLLGDSDFPLEPWLMTPYKIAEPGSKEAYYNAIHAKCRETIRSCFGILKGRFRCLSSINPLEYTPAKAAQVINVACMLHNICIQHNVVFDETLFLTETDDEDYNLNQDIPEDLDSEAAQIRNAIKNAL